VNPMRESLLRERNLEPFMEFFLFKTCMYDYTGFRD
jgi:hypothetical protein